MLMFGIMLVVWRWSDPILAFFSSSFIFLHFRCVIKGGRGVWNFYLLDNT